MDGEVRIGQPAAGEQLACSACSAQVLRDTGRSGSSPAGSRHAAVAARLTRGALPRYVSTASTTSRQVSICGSTCSGKRPPKVSSSEATISIRSSESSPSSSDVRVERQIAGALLGDVANLRRARSRRVSSATTARRSAWRPRRRSVVAFGAAADRRRFGRRRRAPLPAHAGCVPRSPLGRRSRSVPARKPLAAGVPLDLAAGRLGNAAGLEQHDGVDTASSCSAATRLRMAAMTRLEVDVCGRRSTSGTTTSRSRPCSLDGERRAGACAAACSWLCSTVSSMSCG